MPRSARIVIPGLPHHITQRGNRKQTIFFNDYDRAAYVRFLTEACQRSGTSCLAWCLMDNHVHLILVPENADSLRAALSSTHTRYSQRINAMHDWSGHLFQGRYASYPMDEAHLMVAVRYIENNPVAAGLVPKARDWRWSSAHAHIGNVDDGLTDRAALGRHVANWEAMLAAGLEASNQSADQVEKALKTGRPLGSVL